MYTIEVRIAGEDVYLFNDRGNFDEKSDMIEYQGGRFEQLPSNDYDGFIDFINRYCHNINILTSGSIVTVTSVDKESYYLWSAGYIWDISKECLGEIVRVISED